MVRSIPWKFALIAVGTLACFSSQTQRSVADDAEGIIRICDKSPSAAGPAVSSDYGPSCQPGQSCPSTYGGRGRYCGVYGYYGNGNCGYYGYGCMKPCGHVHQFLDWFNPHGMCVHSPDHGYAPPGKIRTPHPQQVAYTKGFPDSWTGGAGGASGGQRAMAIYMPTDTTQLGYYYQAAPRWLPNARMLPPTPVPSQWHQDLCQGQGSGCRTCRGHNAGNCPNCRNEGHIIDGGQVMGEQIINERVIESNPQPVQPHPADVGPMEQAPVEPPAEPAPVNPAPAAAPLEKAENLNLRPLK